MKTGFDMNRVIEETYAEMLRCYENPATHDKARQHRRFLRDHCIAMSSLRAQGRAEGRTEGKVDSILYYLKRRFLAVPQDLDNRIRSLTDSDKLDRLADLVLDCQSLEEFERGVE